MADVDPALLTEGSYADQMRRARELQNLAYQQAAAKIDPTQLEALARRRSMRGVQDEGMGAMFTAQGPEETRPLGRALSARGLAAREPWEVAGGIIQDGQYTADPAQHRDRLTRALAAQAQAAKGFAGEASEQEGRVLARALARQQLDAGKLIKLNQDGRDVLYDTVNRRLIDPTAMIEGTGAPGAGSRFPERPGAKASEDERRTAYQAQALAARQQGIDPRYAGPGFMEAAARTVIPGEAGEAVANFLSPAARQQARQSQEGIVDSLLYLATGAAYNKEQLTQARREFLPAYTDRPETVAAKRAKLAQLAESARNRAGRAWTRQQEEQLISAFPELALPGDRAAAPRAPAGAPGQRPSVQQRAAGYMSGN